MSDHGICHNDLDESNVMITSDNKLVIIDFGLSKTTKKSISKIATSTTDCNDAFKFARYMKNFTSNKFVSSIDCH